MTLIVSLHIPDGIIIAGDSLATMMREIQIEGELEVKCPDCGHVHKVKHKVPYPAPSTTFSYAQKVFPFLEEYGIGTFGAGMLVGKSIYFAIREFERVLKKRARNKRPQSVQEAAEYIGNHLHDLLTQQLQREGQNVNNIPDNAGVLGLQLVGYDNSAARIIEVHVGKQVMYAEPLKKYNHGCTVSGQQEITSAIFEIYKKNPSQQAQYSNFSIQDAIEYAKFLITATSSHQQFSSQMPNVGGDIDIALVTPFEGFKWIQQKPLGKLLSGNQVSKENNK